MSIKGPKGKRPGKEKKKLKQSEEFVELFLEDANQPAPSDDAAESDFSFSASADEGDVFVDDEAARIIEAEAIAKSKAVKKGKKNSTDKLKALQAELGAMDLGETAGSERRSDARPIINQKAISRSHSDDDDPFERQREELKAAPSDPTKHRV